MMRMQLLPLRGRLRLQLCSNRMVVVRLNMPYPLIRTALLLLLTVPVVLMLMVAARRLMSVCN